jgi:N utilization substance protein A
VRDVVVLDEGKRQALAVVNESQLSLAIGKQGLNVRLANRLVDWNIDVKTEEQFLELDIAAESRRAVSELFGEYDEEISRISELPGVDEGLAEALKRNNIEFIEDYLALDGEQLAALEGVTQEQLDALQKLIEENVEIVEEDDYEAPSGEVKAEESAEAGDTAAAADTAASAEEGEEPPSEEGEAEEAPEEYECPECGAKITTDMTSCPNCGIGLSFEYEED